MGGSTSTRMAALASLVLLAALAPNHALSAISCPAAAPVQAERCCGFYTNPKPADQAVADVLASVDWQAKVSDRAQPFKICSYQTQVVNGVNYKVLVALEGGQTANVTVYKPGTWVEGGKPKLGEVTLSKDKVESALDKDEFAETELGG